MSLAVDAPEVALDDRSAGPACRGADGTEHAGSTSGTAALGTGSGCDRAERGTRGSADRAPKERRLSAFGSCARGRDRRQRRACGQPAAGARRRAPGTARLARGPAAGGSGWAMLAWRHTLTKRWPAVRSVSASMTQRIGTSSQSNRRPKPEHDDALGPLHEPAPGVEAQRLGLGPLVGDEHRGGEHREGQHGDAARLGGGEEPGHAAEEQRVGDAVGHRVEEGAAGRAVPEALATAPSSTSGMAVRVRSRRPARRAPLPMATAAPAAMSTPSPVRWSAVMPVFLRFGADRAQAGLRLGPKSSVEHVLLRALCAC